MARAFIFFFLIISNSIFGQKKAFNGFLIDYSYQFPLGQLAETFSNNSAIGINLINKKENNFFYGLKTAYIFGGNIKNNTIFDTPGKKDITPSIPPIFFICLNCIK